MKGRLYVALDVNFYDHPKVIAAGEKADRLYTQALTLAKRTWSDGFISDEQLRRLGLSHVHQRAKRLESVGLFEREATRKGWLIHDWSDHNRTKDEQDRIVEKRRSAGSKGGKVSKQLAKQDADQVGQPDLICSDLISSDLIPEGGSTVLQTELSTDNGNPPTPLHIDNTDKQPYNKTRPPRTGTDA